MGTELFSALAPTDDPRGFVLLAHGFGEHRGRYGYFTDALTADGYDVWSFDFSGHGTADGRRACVDVGSLIGEHLEVRKEVLKRSRTNRMFLFGHSMGGLITLASTLLAPTHIHAVAVTGPALRPLPLTHPRVAALGVKAARIAPWLNSVSIDLKNLSRDPQVAIDYEADPLVHHGKVPLLTGASMVVQGDYVLKNAPILACPVLMLHGEDDGLADFTAPLEFAERAGDLVEIQTIPGAYHELLNEPEKEIYAQRIIDWYNQW